MLAFLNPTLITTFVTLHIRKIWLRRRITQTYTNARSERGFYMELWCGQGLGSNLLCGGYPLDRSFERHKYTKSNIGLAWLGLVWLGLDWFGLARFGLVWLGLVWLD